MIKDFIIEEKDKSQMFSTASKEMLSVNEAAEYLCISHSSLYKMTSKRTIDYYKPNNGKIFFKKSDLDAWLLKSIHKSIDSLERQAKKLMKECAKWEQK